MATSLSSHGVRLKAGAGIPVAEVMGSLLPDTHHRKRTVQGSTEESPRRLGHNPRPRPGCQGHPVPGAWRAGYPAPSEHLAAAPRDRVAALEAAGRLRGRAQKERPGLRAARWLGRRAAPSNAAALLGLLRPTAAQVTAGLDVPRWAGKAALSAPA